MALIRLPPPLNRFQKGSNLFQFFEFAAITYFLSTYTKDELLKLTTRQIYDGLLTFYNNPYVFWSLIFASYPAVFISRKIVTIIFPVIGAIMDGVMTAIPTRYKMPAIYEKTFKMVADLFDAVFELNDKIVDVIWVDKG